MNQPMTPHERAAALIWRLFGIVEMQPYQRDVRIEWILEHDKETRRAALLEAAQRADLGDCNSLLDAPCLWCGYNGEGYWQPTTHDLACPWHNVGGRFDRVVALDRLAQEG